MSRVLIEVRLPPIPSTNALYSNVPGKGRVKTTTYKRFIRNAGLCVLQALRGMGQPTIKENQRLRFELDICDRWFTRTGTPKKADIDNRIKAAQDAVMSAIGIDDSHIFEVIARKIEGKIEESKARVILI